MNNYPNRTNAEIIDAKNRRAEELQAALTKLQESKGFWLQNLHNQIEAAKYQLARGNHALTLEFLNTAQKTIAKLKTAQEKTEC